MLYVSLGGQISKKELKSIGTTFVYGFVLASYLASIVKGTVVVLNMLLQHFWEAPY